MPSSSCRPLKYNKTRECWPAAAPSSSESSIKSKSKSLNWTSCKSRADSQSSLSLWGGRLTKRVSKISGLCLITPLIASWMSSPRTQTVDSTNASCQNCKGSAPVPRQSKSRVRTRTSVLIRVRFLRRISRLRYSTACPSIKASRPRSRTWSITSKWFSTIQYCTARSWWHTTPPSDSSNGNSCRSTARSRKDERPSTKRSSTSSKMWQTALKVEPPRVLLVCSRQGSFSWQLLSQTNCWSTHSKICSTALLYARAIMGYLWRAYWRPVPGGPWGATVKWTAAIWYGHNGKRLR